MLVFEGEITEGLTTEDQARRMLSTRLSEALPISIVDSWASVF